MATTTAAQVNSVYDLSYFDAAGNEYYSRKNNNYLWWASSDRETGTEYVEIDLGKRRGINYVSFDIMRKPIDIEIQYDRVDLDDLDQYSDSLDRRWTPVKSIENAQFTSAIDYDSDYANPWRHAEFFFTDENGEFLVARRLRFKFTRRDQRWPTPDFKMFLYGIDVKNLRVARYITEQDHLRGVMFGSEGFTGSRIFPDEIRQNIIVPSTYEINASPTTDLSNIGGFTPAVIYPRVSQFNFLVTPKDRGQFASFEWVLVDTTVIETVLARGVQNFKFNPAKSNFDLGESPEPPPMPEWFRITLSKPVEVRSERTYQMRLRNLNRAACNSFYVSSPSLNSTFATSGELVDLYEINSVGAFSRVRNTSMSYQVVGLVGAGGKDLLGNEYREGVRFYDPNRAIDNEVSTNWTCFPNPSPDGVEALYFDVREIVDGVYRSAVIDSITLTTLTPGVMLNVYYSEQKVDGVPDEIEEWENILWTPVRGSYRLNNRQTLELPYPIKASWVCLEFYNLQAMPMELPNYPILPEVEYKEFPQWVVEANDTVLALNDQAQLQNETFASFTVPEIFGSEIENISQTRIYADAPYTLEDRYYASGFGTADPKLLSRISLFQNMYSQPTIERVDTSSLLGSNVFDSYSSDPLTTFDREATLFPRIVNSRSVSNTNNRYEYSRTEENSIFFSRVATHEYSVKKARFNKKAYFVSVSEVAFARKDYSIEADDPVIHDVLVYQDVVQSPFVEESSFEAESRISIPVGSSIFVSYEINGISYENQRIEFEPFDSPEASFQPVDLPGVGGIATKVIASSGAFGGGETYYRNQDFIIVYDASAKKNRIQRNDIPARLVISQIIHSIDKFTVSGSGTIVTEVYANDIIELGDKNNVVGLARGASSISNAALELGVGSGLIRGTTTIYATLSDD